MSLSAAFRMVRPLSLLGCLLFAPNLSPIEHLSPQAAAAAVTTAEAPADSHGVIPVPWRLFPSHPCGRDTVALIFRGYHATACDSFIGVERRDDGSIVVRTQTYENRDCFAPPSEFYDVPVVLGQLAAGFHTVTFHYEAVLVRGDGTRDTIRSSTTRSFEVTQECGAPPHVTELPFVLHVQTDPVEPCPQRPTSMILMGLLPDACWQVTNVVTLDPQHVRLVIRHSLSNIACEHVMPWRAEFPLGILEPGPHRVHVEMMVVDQSGQFDTEIRTNPVFRAAHDFQVGFNCDSIPPPPPGPLPFVQYIAILPAHPYPDLGRRICETDSIRVVISGEFPDDCHYVRRVELLPSPRATPLPHPPIVRILVDDQGCLDRPCVQRQTPWFAQAVLPPLPPRDHEQIVQLAEVTCSDSVDPGRLHSTAVPFHVAPRDSCGPLQPCFVGGWDHRGRIGECDAAVSARHPASVVFQVRTSVALSALQGALRFDRPGLRITGLEATGPATGMHLSWQVTADGARFVMFAQRGAPITPSDSVAGVPVLRVTAELAADSTPELPARLRAEELLGSDANGTAVRECLSRVLDLRLPDVAVICAERACDANGDGQSDVRDLVLMVRCVTNEGPCPDSTRSLDCDGDSTLALADVICCARHILRSLVCPECPVDSVRAEPGVRLAIGEPVENHDVLEVPLTLSGARRLGAARLDLRYPTDRFEVVALMLDPGATGWLALHEVVDDRVTVGLIGGSHSVIAPAPAELSLVLRLRMRTGQVPGGTLRVTDSQFSGPDGTLLRVELGQTSRRLDGEPGVDLSNNRPEPFSSETRFELSLERAAQVTLGVYDITGRRLALLHHGWLEAGAHPFRWNGRAADGREAPNGVYFYRAEVEGKAVGRKMVLIRGG
jgi:flagellar hook capping protein FlgD